jgi:hypothetical protein
MYLQGILGTEGIPYGQMASCPGKKAFSSPKKAVILLFPIRASAVSARLSLCHRLSLRRQRRGSGEGFSRPFLASTPAFFIAQRDERAERPTELEMI